MVAFCRRPAEASPAQRTSLQRRALKGIAGMRDRCAALGEAGCTTAATAAALGRVHSGTDRDLRQASRRLSGLCDAARPHVASEQPVLACP